MKVKILKTHISKGLPNDALSCPIALALEHAYEGVTVNEDTIELNGLEFKLPAKAKRFIRRFDDGKEVKPFAFELTTLCE